MLTNVVAKSKTKTLFVCQNCGAQRPRWEGKCTDCGSWNSFVEETLAPVDSSHKGWAIGPSSDDSGKTLKPVTLDQSLEVNSFVRMNTSYEELDRVLGGGLVQGSFVLLGGSPGIGKSTLLLQMAGGLAEKKHTVLYVSGEESVGQTGSRAQRLGIRSREVSLIAENNLARVIDLARQHKPKVLIVDSIQTCFLPDLPAAPGSVSQVRECAGHLMTLAKSEGITVLLIGHVTKDGTIAGPKVLEHMVDCVLSFEGDLSHQFRLLRCLKNRFGATHELGVFRMAGKGLEEVTNPSEFFLEDRGENLIGSAVFASMEGSRPLLCEIQALTLATPMAMPRRTSIGIEVNRLHMITAVLDRHLDIRLAHSDIFINVVGGLKLAEPSSDLALAAAVLSTEGRKELGPKTVFFGEIGLTGEVRAVSFADLRLKEADKLGFENFVLPYSNKKHLSDLKLGKDKKIHWVKNIKEFSSLIDRGI